MSYKSLRELLSPWGALQPQSAQDWNGDFPLPPVVAEFYEHVGPWGEVLHVHHGQTGLVLDARPPVTIPPLRRLWEFQKGFRWNANSRDRLERWKDEWLLVAVAEADPFILDIPSGRILFAHHGSGGWYPQPFAPDLETAFGSLATIANTKSRLEQLDAFIDEGTLEIFPAATEEVVTDLATYLGSKERARDILRVMDWG